MPSLLNTWAIGDCASTGEMKTAVAAGQHARAVARNIVDYVMVGLARTVAVVNRHVE